MAKKVITHDEFVAYPLFLERIVELVEWYKFGEVHTAEITQKGYNPGTGYEATMNYIVTLQNRAGEKVAPRKCSLQEGLMYDTERERREDLGSRDLRTRLSTDLHELNPRIVFVSDRKFKYV